MNTSHISERNKGMRFTHVLNVSTASLLAFLFIGLTATSVKSKGTPSLQHLEAIKSACESMYPDKRARQIKCRGRMRSTMGPFFNFDSVSPAQRNKIIVSCEYYKWSGDPEDRVVKYDQCLRNAIGEVAPEKVPAPPKLAIKPYLLLGTVNCGNLPFKTVGALNTYSIKFKEYFRGHVRKVLNLNNTFLTGFWCKNKTLYFKHVRKKYWKKFEDDRKFYVVMLQLVSIDQANFNLEYELFDIKTQGLLYEGRANSKPIALSQAPSLIFKQVKNARNQIIQQIIKYDPSN